ncbi:polyisoprenoid-binding protein [bacterium]|nr:polyisoprenoid-binding protein [bacterium]
MKLKSLRIASAGFLAATAVAFATLTPTATTPVVAQEAAASAANYEIDAVHTSVLFRVMHFNTTPFYGRFNKISGSVKWDEANPAGSSIDLTIDAASVDTNNEKRDQHLRGADFFNASEFPAITFKSKSIEKVGDVYKVSGPISFNGTTKDVTVEFTKTGEGADPWGGYRIGGEATFTLKRSEFGIKYMPNALGEDVKVIVAIEGIKK